MHITGHNVIIVINTVYRTVLIIFPFILQSPDNRYIADVVSVVREERSIRENTRQANATTNVDAKYARTENSRLESVTDDLKRTQENVKI